MTREGNHHNNHHSNGSSNGSGAAARPSRVRPEERGRYLALGWLNAAAALGWVAVALATGVWFVGLLALGCAVIATVAFAALHVLRHRSGPTETREETTR